MSNRELPMMPWYPDQFAASTVTMRFAERVAYRALLDIQWQLGVIPDDLERLSGAIGCTIKELENVWPTVHLKFKKVRGGLQNFRLEQHRLAAKKYIESKKLGAQMTNAKRWGNSVLADAHSAPRSRVARRVARRDAQRRMSDVAERVVSVSPLSPSPSPSEESEHPLPPQGGWNGASAPSRKGPDRLRRDVSREAWTGSTGRIDQVRSTAKLPSDQRLTWAYVQEHVDPIAWEAIQQIGGCNVIADRDRYTEENLKQRFREAYEQRSAPA